MIDVATETDIEVVRQVAMLLEYENDRLYRRLKQACGEDAAKLQLELDNIKAQLAKRNRDLFGRSSEKRSRTTSDENGKSAEPRRGHGPTEQPELPIIEQVHELDEPDKACPSCGGDLAEMAGQFEECEEVDVVERSFRVIRHKRKKYTCKCGSSIETAPAPARLIPGGRYSVGFAAEVAIEKYCEHAPLERQVRQMARQGLTVTSQTLWDQIEALARHLRPSYQALRDHVLASPVIGADETTWKVIGKGKSKTWWAWSIANDDTVYYQIDRSRSAEAAGRILGEYQGTAICDGYAAYGALSKARNNSREGPATFRLAHCWAHARRKFLDAQILDERAGPVIDLIGELYQIEAEARDGTDGDLYTRRRQLRQDRSRAIVDEIRKWMLAERALPQSPLGKAIRYADGLWEGLCVFLDDPRVAIDNNAVERSIRGVALGRRNHYGSRSERGTEVAALFYSLIESAKLAGVEPAGYLREATRRAIDTPGTVTLPHHLRVS